MADLAAGVLQRQMETLFEGGAAAGLSDRELLERFIARHDAGAEAAFTALVARHGPLVWGICRQVLHDRHHAEDAFQAVFFVLACKAGSIRNPDLLGTWLYGVSLRTARKAKTRIRRQRENEARDSTGGAGGATTVRSTPLPADVVAMAREHAEILHAEIARLPRAFRFPVVLCYFEGLTLDEAARRLKWPPGTLRSRLARSRDKLRRALTRRGVMPSDDELAVLLGFGSAPSHLPTRLCDLTTKGAIRFSGGLALDKAMSPSALAIAQGVLRLMLIDKTRWFLVSLLVFASVATGIGYLTHALGQSRVLSAVAGGRQQSPATPDEPIRPLPGRTLITGRVLDPQGRPVPNATVMVYSRLRSEQGKVAGHTETDELGSFHLDVATTSSQRYLAAGVVALAPGFGAGWVEFNPDNRQPTGDITLRFEQVIHGRLFDVKARPAPGVTVMVSASRRVIERNPDRRREQEEGPLFWRLDSNDLPGWPGPAVSDSEGRFRVHGIGRDLRVFLTVNDSRFAQQDIEIETDGTPGSKHVTMALQPSQIIVGRVTCVDTGKPASGAWLSVRADKDGRGRMSNGVKTDNDGRFRANPAPGDRFVVYASPPDGQPYLSVLKSFNWPKGAVDYSVDLALPRGVLIRGKVSEQGSGKPIAGAIVTFSPFSTGDTETRSSNGARTTEDGTYQLTAVPAPGYFAIEGPSTDFVYQAMSYQQYFEGQPRGPRIYAHAFVACDPKPGSAEIQVNVSLHAGVTVKGDVIGPDGQPVPDTWLISRVILRPLGAIRQGWSASHAIAQDGRFEIHGLDPDVEVPVYFLEPKRKLGATAYLSGKSASRGAVTIRLAPCLTAMARLVDPNGKPVGGFSRPWLISMVVTPGPFNSIQARKEGLLLADEARLGGVDRINYEHDPISDAHGRIIFPALIPGATYRIIDRTPFRGPNGPQHRKDFTVKPGDTLDLGDILIEKPQA
jgi:RNA polymerase sigma factor (sigma-70 family)